MSGRSRGHDVVRQQDRGPVENDVSPCGERVTQVFSSFGRRQPGLRRRPATFFEYRTGWGELQPGGKHVRNGLGSVVWAKPALQPEVRNGNDEIDAGILERSGFVFPKEIGKGSGDPIAGAVLGSQNRATYVAVIDAEADGPVKGEFVVTAVDTRFLGIKMGADGGRTKLADRAAGGDEFGTAVVAEGRGSFRKGNGGKLPRTKAAGRRIEKIGGGAEDRAGPTYQNGRGLCGGMCHEKHCNQPETMRATCGANWSEVLHSESSGSAATGVPQMRLNETRLPSPSCVGE